MDITTIGILSNCLDASFRNVCALKCLKFRRRIIFLGAAVNLILIEIPLCRGLKIMSF